MQLVARRRRRSLGEELVEDLLHLAVVALIVLCAVAILLAVAVVDLVAIVVCKLRKVEHRGMRLSSSFAYLAIHRQRRPVPLRVASLGELLALSATEFEEAIAQSLRDGGYTKVERRGGPGDLGVDITCTDPNGERLALQCKRYAPGGLVGSRDLQLFIGMIHTEHNVDRGVYVTTSSFTTPARKLAERHNINLIDGPTLSRILGVSAHSQPAPAEEQHAPAKASTEAVFVGPEESKPFCTLTLDELQALETLVAATQIELPLTIVKPLSANARMGAEFATLNDMLATAEQIERAAQQSETSTSAYRSRALIAVLVRTLRNGGEQSLELPVFPASLSEQ